MLSQLLINKLEKFFYILDYDRNGIIEKADFTAIGENLCVLWGIKEDDPQHDEVLKKFEEGWVHFDLFINSKELGRADWTHWIKFAEERIVGGDESIFGAYVDNYVGGLFDNFDTDKDGYIDLDEFIDLFVAYRIEVRFAAKSFRKIDRNKDGLISRGELITAVKEFFRSDDPEAPGNWLFGSGIRIE